MTRLSTAWERGEGRSSERSRARRSSAPDSPPEYSPVPAIHEAVCDLRRGEGPHEVRAGLNVDPVTQSEPLSHVLRHHPSTGRPLVLDRLGEGAQLRITGIRLGQQHVTIGNTRLTAVQVSSVLPRLSHRRPRSYWRRASGGEAGDALPPRSRERLRRSSHVEEPEGAFSCRAPAPSPTAGRSSGGSRRPDGAPSTGPDRQRFPGDAGASDCVAARYVHAHLCLLVVAVEPALTLLAGRRV